MVAPPRSSREAFVEDPIMELPPIPVLPEVAASLEANNFFMCREIKVRPIFSDKVLYHLVWPNTRITRDKNIASFYLRCGRFFRERSF